MCLFSNEFALPYSVPFKTQDPTLMTLPLYCLDWWHGSRFQEKTGRCKSWMEAARLAVGMIPGSKNRSEHLPHRHSPIVSLQSPSAKGPPTRLTLPRAHESKCSTNRNSFYQSELFRNCRKGAFISAAWGPDQMLCAAAAGSRCQLQRSLVFPQLAAGQQPARSLHKHRGLCSG